MDITSLYSNRPATAAAPAKSLRQWSRNVWRLTALPLALFFAIPVLALVARATPAHFIETLARPTVLQAIRISLQTTLISLAITLVLGSPLAYLMSRSTFRLRPMLDALIDLPTVLPPTVAGVALMITFGRRGLLGGWLDDQGISIAFTQAAVVMAQVFIASPFFVRAATIGFAAIEPELAQAAQLDGASRWQVFRYVILPLSRTALLTGGMMSWARALGEFGATIMFAGNLPGLTQTMPTAIYLGFEVDIDIAITLSVILVAIAFLSILGVKLLANQQPE